MTKEIIINEKSLQAVLKQYDELEQENKELRERLSGKTFFCENCEKLARETEKLLEENIKVKKEFNNLIAEIISDVEFTGEIASNGETTIEHLHKCQNALHALEEIKRVINLAHKVEDYQLGQDYTDLVNRIDKELEVLG